MKFKYLGGYKFEAEDGNIVGIPPSDIGRDDIASIIKLWYAYRKNLEIGKEIDVDVNSKD